MPTSIRDLAPVRVSVPAAEEARCRALNWDAYQSLLGELSTADLAQALFEALSVASVGGVPLRERLLYEGVDLWQFLWVPLMGSLRPALEVIEVCHRLIERHRPKHVILCGVGGASDAPWRYALSTFSTHAQIPYTDTTSSRVSGVPGTRAAHAAPAGTHTEAPRLAGGIMERVQRRIGSGLSHFADVLRPRMGLVDSPLLIVSWSRHWTRLYDVMSGTERTGDEQFDAIVRAAVARGFRPMLGIDVYSGYRRHGSSRMQALLRDVPDGLRTVFERMFVDRMVRWRTFYAYATLSTQRRYRANRGQFTCLAHEALKSPAVGTVLTHRGVSLLPLVRHDLVGVLGAYATECALGLDVARAVIERVRPAAILVTNQEHPAVRALVTEGARTGVPTVGLQDGAYSAWGVRGPWPATTTRPVTEPFKTIIPVKTCVWGQATKDLLVRYGGYQDDAVAVTGNWRYDVVLAARRADLRERLCARLGLDPRAKVVVLATPDLSEAPTLASWVIRALRTSPEFQLVVKTHPGQDASVYARLIAREGTGRERLMAGRLYEVLLVCDVLITEASTVALEAALLDKPVIETNFCAAPSRGYVESGMAVGVDAGDDLAASLRRVLSDPAVMTDLAAARRAFIAEHLCTQDGRSAERVVDVVEDLISHRPTHARAAASCPS